MAGFFYEGERILKGLMDVGITHMEYYYGLDLELHRTHKDIHTDVYGNHAGGKTSLEKNFTGILVSDDFFASDNAYSGNFNEGFLYTSDKDVMVGDVVAVKSADNKIRRFKIILRESLGTQTEVINRFKLSNLGD